MTFEEIMNFHPRNKRVYEQILEMFNNIVPYIGAGLSANIIPTWKSALTKLCENITDSKEKESMALSIDDDLFSAASKLEEYLGTFNFCEDVIKLLLPERLA